MQSQELDLELLTYGERNSRLISTIRNELNELNAFNSSTGGYGSDNGVRGKVPPAINKRQSGKDTKGKKKVVIKAPAAGEGEDRQGSNPDEEEEIKDEKGNVLNPRYERSKSILVAKPANEIVDLPETVIASVETSSSCVLRMAMLARKTEEETKLRAEERRKGEERKRIEQMRLKAEEDRNESLRRAAEASGMLPTMRTFNKGVVSFGIGGNGK